MVTDGRRRIVLPAPVQSLGVYGEQILAGRADGRVTILDRRLRHLGDLDAHGGAVTSLVSLRDGRFATAGEDDRIRIWAGLDGPCVAERAHEDFVRSLAVTPDGRLVSGAYDGRVRIWDDVESGRSAAA